MGDSYISNYYIVFLSTKWLWSMKYHIQEICRNIIHFLPFTEFSFPKSYKGFLSIYFSCYRKMGLIRLLLLELLHIERLVRPIFVSFRISVSINKVLWIQLIWFPLFHFSRISKFSCIYRDSGSFEILVFLIYLHFYYT